MKTTCPYCGVGCGVIAERDRNGEVEITGDPDHPANFGRICSKGAALEETLSLQDRLLHPVIDGERTTWDLALSRVADRISESIETYGPDSVAMYVSGQLTYRGLLRRQQIHEGVRGFGEYRYEFTALHGVNGRGS